MIPEVNPYNNYRGDGSATHFDYDFMIQNGSQLIVQKIDENDVAERLVENIDYEIVVIDDEYAGYIRFPIEDSSHGILQENETLSLQLTLPFEQISEYGQSSLLDLNSIEFSLDYLTRLCQILKRQLERSVKVNEGSDSTPTELLDTINNNALVSTNAAALASKKADEALESANIATEKAEEIDGKILGFNEAYEDMVDEITQEGEKQIQNVQSTGFYMRDDKLYFINSKGEEEEFKSGGSGYNLGDMIITDHILEGEEAIGKALQGTYVSGAIYPDFYNRYLNEYKNSGNQYETWEQPVLTADGTLGSCSFAVYADSSKSGNEAHKAFDKLSTTYWYGGVKATGNITFYNCIPLNVTNLEITNTEWPEDCIATGEILASNDGEEWENISTFTGNTTKSAVWNIDLKTNTKFYTYYKINILSTGSASYPPAIANINITATQKFLKHPNGHKFYSIEDKPCVDAFYETYGIADFYGIDEENERIFLPRNKHFFQLTDDTTKVNQMMEAGLPNIEGEVGVYGTSSSPTGAFYYTTSKKGAGFNAVGTGAETIMDASLYNPIYGNSDTVQPPSSLKLLYYVVGNVVVNKADIDVSKVLDEAVLKSSLEEAHVVIEAYENGTSGYRTWSDGYHEEWGQSAVTTATTVILLLKSYKNTSYNISMTGSTGYPFITSRTIGSFVADTSANATVDWKTSGYLY